MMTGIIQCLIEVLEQAFRNLQLNIPAAVLEDLAITVHRAMSVEGRQYHTPEHVLALASPENPIQSLAALFHDIVYYQVDRGFSSEVMEIIWPYIGFDASVEAELSPAGRAHPDDLCYREAMGIFNFTAGQKLFSSPGFNEFLSALVMAKKLRDLVPKKVLLQVMVDIEATIPFRGKDIDGRTAFDRLEEQLRKVSTDFQIPLSETEIEDTIRGAVIFANKDVENFSERDPAQFLNNTWKLLPETNLALRSGLIYSIRDYRLALHKMDMFFRQVLPEQVFHCYKGTPPAEEYWEKVQHTRQNIQTARLYLGIKLLTIGILEALAECTGGDAPLSLFMGDVQREGEAAQSLAEVLPLPPMHPAIEAGSVVYELLANGNANNTEFTGLRNSPLPLFIYRSLGPAGVTEGLQHAQSMFEGSLDPEGFLQRIDPQMLSVIARVCAITVPTRSEKLSRFIS